MTTTATSAADFPRLLADVGGTNVRFVLESAPRRFGPVSAYRVADFPSLEAAIRRFLASDAGGAAPRHAAVGWPIRSPATGQADQPQLGLLDRRHAALAGLDILLALNDFTALALALPHLPKQGLAELRAGAAQRRALRPGRARHRPGRLGWCPAMPVRRRWRWPAKAAISA